MQLEHETAPSGTDDPGNENILLRVNDGAMAIANRRIPLTDPCFASGESLEETEVRHFINTVSLLQAKFSNRPLDLQTLEAQLVVWIDR